MTVIDVWGLIDNTSRIPISRSGDVWSFQVPTKTGIIFAEFWAEDEAGNIGYRSAVLDLRKPTAKCVRWLPGWTSCKIPQRCATMTLVRPEAVMHCHECPRGEA